MDGDGTSHTWILDKDTLIYKRPAGVALDLHMDPNVAADRRWTLTRPDGTRFYFQDTGNAGGSQTYIRDRNGNETKFNYDLTYGDTRLLTSITDAAGRTTLTLGYVANSNHLKYVRDYSDRGLRFTYTGDQLTQLVDGGKYDPATDSFGDPATKTFKFGYTADSTNGNAKLTSVVDPRNSTTALTYYASTTDSAAAGKLQTLTDRRGKVTEFAYTDPDSSDGLDMQATVTGVSNEAGVVKRYNTSYRMDGYGRPTKVTNANNQDTKLGWDQENNVVQGCRGEQEQHTGHDAELCDGARRDRRQHSDRTGPGTGGQVQPAGQQVGVRLRHVGESQVGDRPCGRSDTDRR